MSYRLREVTLEDGGDVDALWRDISSGRLPLLFDSNGQLQKGLSPVTRYAHGADGGETVSVLAVTAEFFQHLNEETEQGRFRRYTARDEGGDLKASARAAWALVHRDGLRSKRNAADYESNIPPAWTKDGAAHTYLYIAL